MTVSRSEKQVKFVLHLCSFAQEANGLLTIVGAGTNTHVPGAPLYLAGFIHGTPTQLCASDLVVEVSGPNHRSELLRVPPPSQRAFENVGEDEEARITLAFDMRQWDVTDLQAGEYEVRVSIGEEAEAMCLLFKHPQGMET